jgi:iron complex outermembrane receptor protein
LTAAFFNRDASKLIDYVKENEEDLWVAENIRDVTSNGIETNVNYSYQMNNFTQRLGLGYTFLNDDIKNIDANFSQYSINSLKHHFTATYTSQFIKNISQTIVYKYAERTTGYSYAIVDASINASIQNFDLSVTANNIFNTEYTETNLVPMPKGNVLFGLKYSFQ